MGKNSKQPFSSKAFCVNNRITMEETAAYTHTFNAPAEGAVRILKEHMRYLLRRANLPRTHPLVENETLDDRALGGVWLGNDLSTPMFWMYSFKLRKVVRLSDPRHFDHILPFLCLEDIPHSIDLSADDICTMHEEDGDTVQCMPLRKSMRFRITASGEPVLVTPDSGALDADSGENSGSSIRGSQIRRSRIKNRHLPHTTRCS